MTTPAPVELLEQGKLELEGRLLTASNATFVGQVTLDGTTASCVYKPVRGERPLWDFPDGTLANRERAAYLVSLATGVPQVPPTVLRDGPFGPGMCQLWIEDDPEQQMVDVVPSGEVPEGWLHVLDAEDQHRRPVSLVHRDHPGLQVMAVLDAVINNADRKGGHVLVDERGDMYGVDHGVCFHRDEKLRTVLWGWAGERLTEPCQEVLHRLRAALDNRIAVGPADRSDHSELPELSELHELLSRAELTVLNRRVDRLLSTGRFPSPPATWPAIPWPAF